MLADSMKKNDGNFREMKKNLSALLRKEFEPRKF